MAKEEEIDYRKKWLELNRAGVLPFVYVDGDPRFDEWNPDPAVIGERQRQAAAKKIERERLDALRLKQKPKKEQPFVPDF